MTRKTILEILPMDILLTPRQVAQRLQVNEQTVRRWLRAGTLKPAMANSGNGRQGMGYRISHEEVSRFIEARAPATQ